MSYLLLKANGKCRMVPHVPRSDKLLELQRLVGDGNITYLPRVNLDEETTLVAIANDDAVNNDLPTNGWSTVLHALGFRVPWMLGGVWGNVVLARESDGGGILGIGKRLIALFTTIKATNNDEEIVALAQGFRKAESHARSLKRRRENRDGASATTMTPAKRVRKAKVARTPRQQ